MYSMTMSGTCATHVLTKAKTESCLVKAPAMHASESVLVVSELLCTGVQANAERHTRNETREMCSCWGYKQHKDDRENCVVRNLTTLSKTIYEWINSITDPFVKNKESITFEGNYIKTFYETDPKVNGWSDGPTSVSTVTQRHLRRRSRSSSFSTATASKFSTRRTRRSSTCLERNTVEMSDEVHDSQFKYHDVFNDSYEDTNYITNTIYYGLLRDVSDFALSAIIDHMTTSSKTNVVKNHKNSGITDDFNTLTANTNNAGAQWVSLKRVFEWKSQTEFFFKNFKFSDLQNHGYGGVANRSLQKTKTQL